MTGTLRTDAPVGDTATVTAARRGSTGPRAVAALVVRDLGGRRLVRLPLLLDLTFGIVNLLVFLFISRLLGQPDGTAEQSAATGLAGAASYFDFVAIGITFMLVLQSAATQLTARIAAEQRGGTLEMLAAQPVPVWALALGVAGYPFVFALLRAGFYLLVLSLLLGLRTDRADWLGVVLLLGLGGTAVLGIGVALMAVSVAVGHGGTVARLLVVGLSFVSGTYFPTAALPAELHPLVAVLPTRLALDGLRAAIAGEEWGSTALALLGTTVVLLPAAIWTFGLALRSARSRGTLTRG
ncbi:ABC transporter permease [Plantactinospora sp. BB1]|uniref:ABC transporter permease n=1 Tax=Plantactinospora sp. BB1 TaxID=2071627 RepID=UPI000D173365|nr:ABC transporter permease [Plantactinospora sp. BB1]AVT39507.1 hypothetical protein C6W10_27135 [Plantactinospora sp. BB1]